MLSGKIYLCTKECVSGFHFSPDFAQDSEGGIGLAFGAGGGKKANPLKGNKITQTFILELSLFHFMANVS